MRAVLLSLPLLVLAACGGGRHDEVAAPRPTEAVAVLVPVAGHAGSGTVRFTVVPDGLRVVADLAGFPPGRRGFHVHEAGDLTASDLASAGAHFDPHGHPHGGPLQAQRHLGDLGNVDVGPDGRVRYQVLMRGATLDGPTGVVGRSVILHAGPDDLTTQPAGDSGARIAGGVIGYVKPR